MRRVKGDSYWSTDLHEAAVYGRLDRMPREVLTAENMGVGNIAGITPLHLAAENGWLNQVPMVAFTGNMLVKDVGGNTPLSLAVTNGYLSQVPLGLELPEEARAVVGEEWWENNQAVLKLKVGLDETEVGAEVDIF